MDVKDVVTTIVAVTVGVLLIGTLLVPQAQSVIDTLNKVESQKGWASLVGVVVIVSIISLVVIALHAYK